MATETMDQQWPRLFAWNQWANNKVFATLRGTEGKPEKALAAFQHVLEAELIWLGRINDNTNPNVTLWGDASMENCEAWLSDVEERFDRFLDLVVANQSPATFSYTNSTGREFTNATEDALLQVLFHSQQYRGEAAAFLNAEGFHVEDFDYIAWLRQSQPA